MELRKNIEGAQVILRNKLSVYIEQLDQVYEDIDELHLAWAEAARVEKEG